MKDLDMLMVPTCYFLWWFEKWFLTTRYERMRELIREKRRRRWKDAKILAIRIASKEKFNEDFWKEYPIPY